MWCLTCFLREPESGLQPHHELQWPPPPVPLTFDLSADSQDCRNIQKRRIDPPLKHVYLFFFNAKAPLLLSCYLMFICWYLHTILCINVWFLSLRYKRTNTFAWKCYFESNSKLTKVTNKKPPNLKQLITFFLRRHFNRWTSGHIVLLLLWQNYVLISEF